MRMVKKADVVVENFRPDVKKRLKIDYKDLKKINPKIILGSISGFGQTGPYAGRPGFDQIAQGMGGLMSVTGLPGQGPVRVGIPIADLCAGLFCAMGILIALLEREKSGQGQHVATSLLQAQIFMLDFQAVALAGEGRGRRARPATIIRPRCRPASTRPPTATSTSPPPARRSGSAWCKAIGAPEMMDNPELRQRARRAPSTATRSTSEIDATP